MPFQVTYTLNYKDTNYPTAEEFVATLDPAVVASYPEVAGKTLPVVYTEGFNRKADQIKNAPGLITFTDEFSADKLSRVITTVWDNKSSYDTAYSETIVRSEGSVYTTPIDLDIPENQPPTAYEYLRTLFINQYCTSYVIDFKDI